MKVNVTQVLKNFNGKALRQPDPSHDPDSKEKPRMVDVTLRDVMCAALMWTSEAEAKSPSADQRLRRFCLAQEVHKNDVVVLKTDDITDVKKRINAMYATNVVAAAHTLLDPAALAEAKKANAPAA